MESLGKLSLIVISALHNFIFRCCGFTAAGVLRSVREAWEELGSWARPAPDQSGPRVRLSDVRDGSAGGSQTLARDHSAY